MAKIKKNIIYCCLIFLASFITQAFGNDYDRYAADLKNIHEKESKQDDIISTLKLTIVKAKENKQQIAEALAVISCSPALPAEDLTVKLYRYVRDNHEWYFDELGCTESKLMNSCRNYVLKSHKELEWLLRQLKHDKKHRYILRCFGKHDRCGLEQALLNISLQNRLAEESYKKCQKMRNILKQLNSEIEDATTSKDIAEKEKQRLVKKSTDKQQKLNHITEQEQLNEKKKGKEGQVTNLPKQDTEQEQLNKENKEKEEQADRLRKQAADQERLNKENKEKEERAAYLQKYAEAIKSLGLDQQGKEAELEQAFKNNINLDEVVIAKRIADEAEQEAKEKLDQEDDEMNYEQDSILYDAIVL